MAKYSYHRLDKNHAEIRQALEQVGASVYPGGPLDLIVGYRGFTTLLEVKTAKGKLRASQKAFMLSWQGVAVVVRTREQALKAIGAIR